MTTAPGPVPGPVADGSEDPRDPTTGRALPRVIPAAPPPPGRPVRPDRIGRDLLVAAIPALVLGLLIRLWIGHTPLLTANSDEALVGLQAREVLHGTFRLMVAGNDYGSTTESYLMAPLLTVTSGTWPLRLLAGVIWFGVSLAVVRLARPLVGPAPAVIAGLLTFTFSGAVVVLSSRPYFGYPTGVLAEVIALAAAGAAMAIPRLRRRPATEPPAAGPDADGDLSAADPSPAGPSSADLSPAAPSATAPSPAEPSATRRLWPIALIAGVATGFAIWSHPMFGLIGLLGLVPPTLWHWRRWGQWWATVAVGGIVGVSPWLVYIAQKGRPQAAYSASESTWVERVGQYLSDLLPRTFGAETFEGAWVRPTAVSLAVSAVLIVAVLGGLVLLVARRGRIAWPIALAGLAGIPALAAFPQTVYVQDARYALPLLPAVVVGLVFWLTLLRGYRPVDATDPDAPRRPRWPVVALPVAWMVLTCVPVTVQQVGWTWQDPDAGAEQVAALLVDNGIRYVRGDYWTTYLLDYYADGALQVAPDFTLRLADEAAAVDAASRTAPYQVALVYENADPPKLVLPAQDYRLLRVGGYDVYLPVVPVGG